MAISDWVMSLPWWDILRHLCYIVGAVPIIIVIIKVIVKETGKNPEYKNAWERFWLRDNLDLTLFLALYFFVSSYIIPMNFPDIDKEARALLLQEIFKSLGSK